MDANQYRDLMEAYNQVHAPIDEATAMAKRGYDEAPIRQKIAKSTGGGESADRASALEKKSTFGDANKEKQRQNLARKQRGDFRKTTSSSPGLHVGQHKSDDPKVKEKQAARGAQRGALTPAEKKQFNREEFDIFDLVLEFLQSEGYAETLEEAEWMMANLIDEEAVAIILGEEQLDEAEGSYGETPKAYSAASKTKMTAKRKPFLKAMQRRTNPANRKDAYDSSRKGMTASDREQARAGSAYGSPGGHDYPSQGPGSVTKNPKKLRKQKAMGEFAKEEFELWVNSLVKEGYDLSDYTWDEMYGIYEEKQLQELSDRKLRAYIKKSDKSHKAINKKWDQGTATEKEKLKSIGHEIGQERAFKRLNKEELDIFDVVLEFLQVNGYAETLEEAEWMMANELDTEDIEAILEAEQLNELSNRKLRAYIKKSSKSHSEINKKWDKGTATEKEKLKSIGHEIGQERAYKKMDKRAGR